MKTTDRLTPELRKIEKEIDNYYKSNPLVNLPFATSSWYLLVAAEKDALEQEFAGIDEINNIHILASEFSVNLEPFHVLALQRLQSGWSSHICF